MRVLGLASAKPFLAQLFVWADLLLCGLFLPWVVLLNRRQQLTAQALDAATLKIDDYAVWVRWRTSPPSPGYPPPLAVGFRTAAQAGRGAKGTEGGGLW